MKYVDEFRDAELGRVVLIVDPSVENREVLRAVLNGAAFKSSRPSALEGCA